MMFIGAFFFLAFVLLLVVFVVWLARSSASGKNRFLSHPSVRSDNSPLEILDQRYARGEIDRVQYQQIKDDLKR
ncbi:MAG: SHOCT domain-containing protein [Anaerolineaceae bacterium]|nr:SHOCT domain-containing protein [Anaerolineaceae bacterium]